MITVGDYFPTGKASVLIDGQFGSTGKGLLAAYLAATCDRGPDIVTTNASANAGHTSVFSDGSKMVLYHLPTAGVLANKSLIYLNAGAVIDSDVLTKEVNEYERLHNISSRLAIHPRAAMIEKRDVLTSSIAISGGTGHGVSGAISGKAKRTGLLMQANKEWKSVVRPVNLQSRMHFGAAVFVETPQGIGLGLNSGLEYPKCTSREVSVAQSLADAQIHPSFLGRVFLSLRTYPIRVGNPTVNDRIVSSGDWYPDQEEVEWESLGVTPEITTVTKRQRRIATYSRIQARHAMEISRPDVIFLNFVQYGTAKIVKNIAVGLFEDAMVLGLSPLFLFGYGPKHSQDVTTSLERALESCRP